MKFKNVLFIVTDFDKTVAFYKKILELHVIMDFGANKTLTGGPCLQTQETLQRWYRLPSIHSFLM